MKLIKVAKQNKLQRKVAKLRPRVAMPNQLKVGMPMKTESELPEGYYLDVREEDDDQDSGFETLMSGIFTIQHEDADEIREQKRQLAYEMESHPLWYEVEKLQIRLRSAKDMLGGGMSVDGNWSIQKEQRVNEYIEETQNKLKSAREELQKVREEYYEERKNLPDYPEVGVVIASQTERDPRIWFISYAQADEGWGPLLYDAAMKYVTEKGGHLISHGEAVKRGLISMGKTSDDAQGVWDYYRDKRKDVERSDLGFRMRSV